EFKLTSGHVTEWLRGREFGIKLLPAECRFVHWQCEKECRSLVEAALHSDRPAVRRYQVLHDGKAQAGATQFAGARLVHAIEALEEARQLLGGDPDPCVRPVQS